MKPREKMPRKTLDSLEAEITAAAARPGPTYRAARRNAVRARRAAVLQAKRALKAKGAAA